ncbi:MAG: hypothetical protein IPN78_19240 [Candidatus Accumulibacter sp.]|nr:hypothetical protein [Candidatus Accumulibacter propinquus]
MAGRGLPDDGPDGIFSVIAVIGGGVGGSPKVVGPLLFGRKRDGGKVADRLTLILPNTQAASAVAHGSDRFGAVPGTVLQPPQLPKSFAPATSGANWKYLSEVWLLS